MKLKLYMKRVLQCSAACGYGVQTRHVACLAHSKEEGECLNDVSEDLCVGEKLAEQQECMNEPCEASWFTAPWTEVRGSQHDYMMESLKRTILYFNLYGNCTSST